MRHPDEGEIHAWLDGALDPATAAGFEAHAAACPACAAAVAEARGLIAGASRILLALDGVPSGVIPAPSQPVAAVPGDELATRRAQQVASARRHVPWYARRPVQIAAGLMLVAGVGGVVARPRDRSAGQVSIQFETDVSPASKGPAVEPTAGTAKKSEAAAESPKADLAAIVPPSPAPQTPSQTANQSPRRADQGAAVGGAGVARERAVDQRQRSSVAEQQSPAPPSAPAPVVVNTPLAAAPLTTPPVLMDSVANPLAAGRLDAPRPSRALTGDPNALRLAGVVVADASAKLPDVAGACFALNVDAGGDVAGLPLLPRRVRIRMAESPIVSQLRREETKSARAAVAAPAAAAARDFAGTSSEPARPLPWQPVAADSIDVTWATESDVVTLRLQIRGDNVSGTATSNQGTPARTATVDGRKVACGGGL